MYYKVLGLKEIVDSVHHFIYNAKSDIT